MINLDSILKIRDISLPTKVHLVTAIVFLAVMDGCESWPVKKAESWRIDAFELWFWRMFLRVPWLQGDRTSPYYRKSVLNSHWKNWCWNSNTLAIWCEELTLWKRPWCWERLKAGGEGVNRRWDEMARWHHWLDGYKFEQAPEVSDGQGSLACYSPWGSKDSGMTELLFSLTDDWVMSSD